MKIEVGESLIRSWLRHVERCEFAELNWKPSTTWNAQLSEQVNHLFDYALTEWPEAIGRNILSQFLKQAEIDVLGLSTSTSKLHLVDIAFHSNNLNYGGQGKTGQRIYKKLVRSALIAMTYFPGHECVVYFTTPVITPGIKSEVEAACKRAQDVFSDQTNISFQLILGDDFKTALVDEVLALGGEVADTSELFLRSWQLVEPFLQLAQNPVEESSNSNYASSSDPSADSRTLMHITALYLSRFGHLSLDIGNQTQTFAHFGQKFGVAANTVKNIRDRFDYYVDNHRAGWNAPLPSSLQVVFDQYRSVSKEELFEMVDS